MTMKNDLTHFSYAYESLFHKLQKYVELTDKEKDLLKDCLRISFYPAKSYFVRTGSKSKQIGFILKGSAIDVYQAEEKDVINKFLIEESFLGNIHSFITQTESESGVLFCESSVVLEFDYFAYLNIKKNFPKIKDIIYGLQKEEVIFYKKRLRSMQIKSAKQRLEELLSENHEIINRFKNTQLATYLGIEQETMSRLKINLNKKLDKETL